MFGFLRCGKFTVRNASDFDVTVNLCISDVLFYDDYAVLKLKESKTDPVRRGICIQLHKINHFICLFLVLQKYIASRIERIIYSSSCDPLFITEFCQPLDINILLVSLNMCRNLSDTTQVYIMAIPLDQVVLLAQARL